MAAVSGFQLTRNKRLAVSAFAFLSMLCILCSPASAQPVAKPVDWDGFKPLAGTWVGDGTGSPGQGTGGFTFSFDLQNTILVRKNYADYPATKDRPAFSHNDLMVIYREGDKFRAVYFDNEQHVINYAVSLSKDSTAIVFVSDIIPGAPRFRLTNVLQGTDSMKISFEIAPPGQPELFKRYIDAVAHKTK